MLNRKFKDSGVLWTLATKYGPAHERLLHRDGTDICSYTRAVLRGLLVVAIITAALTLAVACFTDFFIWLGVMIYFGHFIEPTLLADVAVLCIGSAMVIFMLVLIDIITEKYRHWRLEREDNRAEREPGQLTQMYLSWKDKHCFKITFDD